MASSAHFSDEELRCKCGCGVNNVTQATVDMAEDIRAVGEKIYGVGRVRMPLSSGYRCPAHNKAEGGAKASQHMRGTAIDFYIEVANDHARDGLKWVRLSTGDIEALALACKSVVGFGRNDFKKFCHADTRAGKRKLWCYDKDGVQVGYYPPKGGSGQAK